LAGYVAEFAYVERRGAGFVAACADNPTLAAYAAALRRSRRAYRGASSRDLEDHEHGARSGGPHEAVDAHGPARRRRQRSPAAPEVATTIATASKIRIGRHAIAVGTIEDHEHGARRDGALHEAVERCTHIRLAGGALLGAALGQAQMHAD